MSTHRQHKEIEHPRRDEPGFLARFGSGLPPGPEGGLTVRIREATVGADD